MVTKEDIISKVRSIMNEIGEDANTSLLDEDTIKIDEYIKSCIPEAVNLVIHSSPSKCVNPKSSSSSDIQKNADGTGSVVLPTDFVKLIAFKMNGWKRIVTTAYPANSEQYKAQCNPLTRAGKSKPVCIINSNKQGARVLEYYSLSKTDTPTIDMFVYEAAYDEAEGLNMEKSDQMFGAVCYMTASLVYNIFENAATSEQMQKVALNLISNAV